MSPTGKFTFKLVIYGAFLLYLVGDLFIWHGFLAGRMDAYLKPMPGPPGDNSERIAEVYGEPLTANQLNRRIAELGILRQPAVLDMGDGMTLTHELDVQKELVPRARYDLISSSLLRLKTRVNDLQLPNRNAEAAQAEKQIQSRFDGDREKYLEMLHGQKLNEEQLRQKIAARLKQTEQLYRATIKVADPTDEELKIYYNLVKDRLKTPDLRQARHIFLSTLHKDDNQVKQAAEALLARLRAGESFERLAKSTSEDERTASAGGSLGWINPARTAETLDLDIASLPDNTPVLVKSKWGWHIMEASPLKKGRVPSYEEVLPALRNAAQSLRRAQATGIYMDGLIEEAHLKNRIKNKQKH